MPSLKSINKQASQLTFMENFLILLIQKSDDEQKRVKEKAISDAERPLPVNHLQ